MDRVAFISLVHSLRTERILIISSSFCCISSGSLEPECDVSSIISQTEDLRTWIPYSEATQIVPLVHNEHPMIVQTSLSLNRPVCTNRPREQLPHEKDVIAHLLYPPLCAHILDVSSYKRAGLSASGCDLSSSSESFTNIGPEQSPIQFFSQQDHTKHSTTTLKTKCLTTTTLPNNPSRAVVYSVASAMLLVVSLLASEVSHQVCLYSCFSNQYNKLTNSNRHCQHRRRCRWQRRTRCWKDAFRCFFRSREHSQGRWWKHQRRDWQQGTAQQEVR